MRGKEKTVQRAVVRWQGGKRKRRGSGEEKGIKRKGKRMEEGEEVEEGREWLGRRKKRWREAVRSKKREKNRGGEVEGKVGGQRKEGNGRRGGERG